MDIRARFLLAIPLLALAACQAESQQAAKPDRPVLVQTIALEARSPERTFVATIRPRIESDLGFRVPGKVARRLVSVGDTVKAGQPLAVLDDSDLRLQQEQAEAEERAATAVLAQAEAELKRVSTLRGEGWSTAANLDRQKAATEEARGRLARAERGLALAKNALSYATLSADGDGVVTAALVEAGQVVSAGQAAIRLARLTEKEAVVAVPEAQLAAVQQGKASLTLWSNPDRRYEARLRELSPSADPTTRTYLARFAIPDADADVQLGMTATIVLSDAAQAKVARLPLSALYNQGSGPAVWVVDVDGRLVLRPVSVEAYEARHVLISGGLAEGDKVVTLGVQKLDTGQRVRIVQALPF
ncbi:MAG TPA: efflux RND transporter periplasmic adaptor subunit [Microvirga sp.]|nr:efflux RND transporter periplasmic adaptor subunit [Microvirga sp.]